MASLILPAPPPTYPTTLPLPDLARIPGAKQSQAERSLTHYVRQAWQVVEPGTEYLHNWHIDLICEYLEAVSAGEILRLIINIPPRYMKSGLVSVMWPTWEWTTKPWTRWLFASHADDLSSFHSVMRRNILESAWYQTHWGDVVQLARDQNRKDQYQNVRRGHMIATSFGGSPLGRGGTRIVVDDPQNPRQAHSEAVREETIAFYTQTLSTRLDDKKQGVIVIVMQRLHERDLTGYLLSQELGFEHLKLPGEAKERTVVSFPRTNRAKVREAGEPLWPEREGPEELATQRIILGVYGYASQYDQEPAPAEGGIIKDAWWRFYDPDLIPVLKQQARRRLQLWDTAYTEKKENDWSVCATWADVTQKLADDVPPGYYLLDLWREQVEFPDLEAAATGLRRDWRPRTVLIENKASGISLAQALKAKKLPVELYKMDGDHVARVHAVTGYLKIGLCHLPCPVEYRQRVLAAKSDRDIDDLPEPVRWVARFVHEHRNFPNATNDDQVDTTSMLLLYAEVNPPEDEVVPMVGISRSVKGWDRRR